MAASGPSAQDSGQPIYEAARLCAKLFKQHLETPDIADKERLVVEDLRGRFDQWAAYVGAFATPKASLDARLGPHGDIKSMVLELLSMVRLNLYWALDNHDEPNDGVEDAPGLTAAEAAINRLLVQAVAIRRSARRINRLRPGACDGQAEVFCSLLIQRQYPNARKSLCDQVAASIHTRGTSLQYLQLHNEKLSYQRDRYDAVEEDQESVFAAPVLALAADPAPARKITPPPETLPSLVSPSAIHRFIQPKRKPTSSIISRGTVIKDERGDDFCYPPLPKPQAGKKYRCCTICADPLDSSILTEEAWRSHVNQDLEPYVCLSEDCSDPIQYFIRMQDWMEHMQTRHTIDWAQKVHTARWYCDVNHDEHPEFDDQASFMKHLATHHVKELSRSQQLGRARRNRRIATRDPFVCPFCDCVPDEVQTQVQEKPYSLLTTHIGKHLKSLAFHSLSHLENDNGSRESGSTVSMSADDEGQMYRNNSRRLSNFGSLLEDDLASETSVDSQLCPNSEPPSLRILNAFLVSGKPESWDFLPAKDIPTDYESLKKGLAGTGRDADDRQDALQYRPLDVQAPEIRIATVHHRHRDSPIRCTLENVSLDYAPEYFALSYVWSKPEGKEVIWLNGRPLTVNKSLALALRRLCHVGRPMMLWADEICVDMHNTQENARQVQLMPSIFSAAVKVVVWLGESTPASDAAFQYLEEHAGVHLDVTPSESFARIQQFSDLCSRGYWRRIWMLQEVCIAREVEVRCGSYSASLERLTTVLTAYPALFGTNPENSLFASSFFKLVNRFRGPDGKRLEPTTHQIIEMLRDAAPLQSSDPLDKLYALLSILPKSFSKSFNLDYRESYGDMLLRFVERYISIGGVEFLGTFHPLHPLVEAQGSDHTPPYPSWLPDLTRPVQGFDEYKPSQQQMPLHKVSLSNRCLEVSGRIVDVISRTYHSAPEENRTIISLRGIAIESLAARRGEPDIAFYDMVSDSGPQDRDFWVSAVRREADESYISLFGGNNDKPRLWDACGRLHGRLMFVTGESRVGLGPLNALQGDLVCLLAGYQIPVVLRRLGWEPSVSHSFVGVAYLDGFMNSGNMDSMQKIMIK